MGRAARPAPLVCQVVGGCVGGSFLVILWAAVALPLDFLPQRVLIMNKVIGAAAGSILSLLLSTAVCAQDETQYLFNGEQSIRLAADGEAGNLHTIHGSIHIGERSKVGDVKTIDGEVVLAKGSRANSVRSLDGAVQLEEDAKLVHGVSTAGGAIVLDDHADVAGRVSPRMGESGSRMRMWAVVLSLVVAISTSGADRAWRTGFA